MADRGGKVYLVGGGPGNPGYLTRRAVELIERADAILYDRLIPVEALSFASEQAELYYVGKDGAAGAEGSVPQERTEQLAVELARAGKLVVRLKGGDPLIFGRGGEEAQRLAAERIPYEIVPGVTAALAAAAEAAIPLTHRGLASAVAFVTAHEDPRKGEDQLDWEALARFPGTLVLYMGVARLAAATARLVAAGRAPSQPAAVVERAGLAAMRTVRAELGRIAEVAAAAGVRPPALTLIGEAVGVELPTPQRPALPLAGLTVAVTRARAQAGKLAGRLAALGAEVVEAPVIRIEELAGDPLDPTPYALLCLTSPNGVGPLFRRLALGGRDGRALAGKVVAAIGPGTAAELERHGIAADIVAGRYIAEGLLEELDNSGLSERLRGGRALVARAREARDTLLEGLAQRGIEPDLLCLYETVAVAPPRPLLARALNANYITFTAASTVRNLLAAARDQGLAPAPTARLVSIGPQTSAALRDHGLEPHVEADRHDIEGVVSALLADAAHR